MDVLDGFDQRLLVVAEQEAAEVQAAPFGEAQQLQHAQRVQAVAAARVDPLQSLRRLAQRCAQLVGETQRPSSLQAQGTSVGGIGRGGGRMVVGGLVHAPAKLTQSVVDGVNARGRMPS